ncbi:hypothetical protein Sjap_024280 [Stephania japonica]|uniref:Pentatricopeptide repeat-containing protein n=1 Tax=Stephania japonica TaxID=461633 RepID=A0AAP0EKD8_9MAGN
MIAYLLHFSIILLMMLCLRFSRTIFTGRLQSVKISIKPSTVVVSGLKGPRPRYPRVWKTKRRIGTISKSKKLVDCIKGLSNVKEEVYGALDSFIAWELEFPLITVKKALKTLEDEKEWKRVIQVFADMEELGVRPNNSIVLMVGDVFQKLGMLDKYEKLSKKYPPPTWEYRYIKGKRVRVRVKELNQAHQEGGKGLNGFEEEGANNLLGSDNEDFKDEADEEATSETDELDEEAH